MITNLRSSGERRSAVHDNRMFAKRAFYCIANGAGELPLQADFLLEQRLHVCYNKR